MRSIIAVTQETTAMIDSMQTHQPITVGDSGAGARGRAAWVATLKTCGLRVTTPRVALLDILSNVGQPLTIDQLHAKAGSTFCDLVTIYRTMAAFEKAGVVHRSGFSARGAVLFSLGCGSTRRYPLIRKGSSVIEELDDESSRELHATIERIRVRLRAKGYGELDHIVEFFAVAPSPACDAPL